MFVRRKYIKGNPYGYLVENSWTNKGPRQKVVKYLGRITEVEQKPQADLSEVEDSAILEAVILHEIPDDVQLDLDKRTLRLNSKPAVLGMNSGVLCDDTLKQVFSGLAAQNESRPGLALATALRNAGLRIDRQDFIRLYLSHQR